MGARSAAWVTACARASVYTAVFFAVTIFHVIPSVSFMNLPLPLPLPPLALALTVEPFETSPLDIDVEKKAQADELSTAEPIDYGENTEDTGPHTFRPPIKDDEDDFDKDEEDDETLRIPPETEAYGEPDAVIGLSDDIDSDSDSDRDVDGDEFDAAIEESNDLKRASSNEIGVLLILDEKNSSDARSGRTEKISGGGDGQGRGNRTNIGSVHKKRLKISDGNGNHNRTRNKKENFKRTISGNRNNGSRVDDGIRSEKRISDVDKTKIRNETEEDTQEIIAKVFELPRSSTVKSLGSRKLGGQMQTIEGAKCNSSSLNATIDCVGVTQTPEITETPNLTKRKNKLIISKGRFFNGTILDKEIRRRNGSNETRQDVKDSESLNRQEPAESNKRSYHTDETQMQAPVEEIVSYDYGEIAEIIIPENHESYGSNTPRKSDRSYGIESYSRPISQTNQNDPNLYRNSNSNRNSQGGSKTSQKYQNYAPEFNANGRQTSRDPPPSYSLYSADADSNSPYFPHDPTQSSNLGSTNADSGKDSGPSTEFEGYYYGPPDSKSQNDKLSSGMFDFTTKNPGSKPSPEPSLNSGYENRGSSNPESRPFSNSYGPNSNQGINLSAGKLNGGSDQEPRPPHDSYGPTTNRAPNLNPENSYGGRYPDTRSRPFDSYGPKPNYDLSLDTAKLRNGSPDARPNVDSYDPTAGYDHNFHQKKSQDGKTSDPHPIFDSHEPKSNFDPHLRPEKLRDSSNPVSRPNFDSYSPKSHYDPNPSSEKSQGGSNPNTRSQFDSYGPKPNYGPNPTSEKSHSAKNSDENLHLDGYNLNSNYDQIPFGREKSYGHPPNKNPIEYEFFETPNSKTWKSHESIPIVNPSTDSGPPIVEIIYHRTNGVVYEDDDEPTLSPEFATTPIYDGHYPEVPRHYPKDFEPKTRNKNLPDSSHNYPPKKGTVNSNRSKDYLTDLKSPSRTKNFNNSEQSIINHEFPTNKEIKHSQEPKKNSFDSHRSKSRPIDSNHPKKITDDPYYPGSPKVTNLSSRGKNLKSEDQPVNLSSSRRKPSKERNSSSEKIRFPSDSDEPRQTSRKHPTPPTVPTRDKSSENLFTFPKTPREKDSETPFSRTKDEDHHLDDFDFDSLDEAPEKQQQIPRKQVKDSPAVEVKKKKKSKGEKNTIDKGNREYNEEDGSKKVNEHHKEEKEVKEKAKKGEKENKETGYEIKKKGEEGKKGNKFDDGENYLKGQTTKGRHEVHKKDEFSRKHSFFDEHHENDQHEKEGGLEVSQKNGEGVKYHAGKKKEAYKNEHKGKEGKQKKGNHQKGGEVKKISEGNDEKEIEDEESYKKANKEEDETKDFEL